MRKVMMGVGGAPQGEVKTWAYPAGQSLGVYVVPVYTLTVTGTAGNGRSVREQFNVLRFGVQSTNGKTASCVGLAEYQSHKIKSWIPTYRVHSASSKENGAWQVYGSFLIHDGPDDDTELFASIGCIEIMGRQGFVKFNDLILSLAGSTAPSRAAQLAEIGRSGLLSVTYERAVRPTLKKAP